MSDEVSTSVLGEAQAPQPLNLYVPHQWFSSSSWSWLYAIKKQPRIGTWTFILEGEDVRVFECKEARDVEIARLAQLEQASANAKSKRRLHKTQDT